MLSPADVRALADGGHVYAATTYHGHGLRFPDAVAALRRCNRVSRDLRTDASGNIRHPEGFVAFGKTPIGQKVRVDFNLIEETDGLTVLVVTAFRVNE